MHIGYSHTDHNPRHTSPPPPPRREGLCIYSQARRIFCQFWGPDIACFGLFLGNIVRSLGGLLCGQRAVIVLCLSATTTCPVSPVFSWQRVGPELVASGSVGQAGRYFLGTCRFMFILFVCGSRTLLCAQRTQSNKSPIWVKPNRRAATLCFSAVRKTLPTLKRRFLHFGIPH